MEGVVIAAFAAIVIGGILLLLFAIPTALILWITGRILGRLASAVAGAGVIVFLIYYAVSSHLSCGDYGACDSPGMMLFAPLIYIGVPAASLVTAILMRKVWVDLGSSSR